MLEEAGFEKDTEIVDERTPRMPTPEERAAIFTYKCQHDIEEQGRELDWKERRKQELKADVENAFISVFDYLSDDFDSCEVRPLMVVLFGYDMVEIYGWKKDTQELDRLDTTDK